MSYGVNILVTAASMRDFSMGTRPLVCQWRGQPGFPKVLGDCPLRYSVDRTNQSLGQQIQRVGGVTCRQVHTRAVYPKG
jgi:hypothetical protein